MINSINNTGINNVNRLYNSNNIKSEEVSGKSVSDILDLTSNSGVKLETYSVNELKKNMPEEIKELLEAFNEDIYRLDGQLTVYDISDFKDNFPFELKSNKIIALKVGSDNSVYNYSMLLKTDANEGKTRYDIQSTNGDNSSVIKEISMFKNTVLKGFMLGSEVLNKYKDIEAHIPDSFALELDFTRNDKKVDFSVFNEILDHKKHIIDIADKRDFVDENEVINDDEDIDKFEQYKKLGLDKILESIVNLRL